MPIVSLNTLKPGQQAVVDHVTAADDIGLKLVELGFCPGETIQFLRKAPLGGPIEVELMAYRICIRRSEADTIFVRIDDSSRG